MSQATDAYGKLDASKGVIMANAKQAAVKKLNMAERAQQQMDVHFPNCPPALLWRRKTNDGYTTVPRTLPIAMQAIDLQSKGTPAGHTLFCLWARSPDHPFITIENPATFAAEAGFFGERAVDTWRKRMKRLRELSFIASKPGPSGEFHYVLLMNPNTAVEWMRSKGQVQDVVYSRFLDRLNDVGGGNDIKAYWTYWQQVQSANAANATKPKEGESNEPAAQAPVV
ncbi:conserved hypothetical protein [Mesorhizobium plurifarium]|uniref:Uncharacterized protein n=1 Tax=Mesorhizobium plurifarium TaxID=69974 RepID=A0A090GPR3_MESPL|nr:conserved hypothetical protein [Mesorhizobium plurifarium]